MALSNQSESVALFIWQWRDKTVYETEYYIVMAVLVWDTLTTPLFIVIVIHKY